TGISLVKNETVMGRTGAIRLDNLLVEKPVGVEELTANSTVKVMPNPASDYVVATADGYITGIELINASGQVLVRNASNYINVSDIPAGVYFVRVYTGEMVTTRKVAVAH
ncbi:MAG: T9SS type A sorting domain-containing protein, partial [Muribaculaceae bacterium]|nr:T9SS type A sorting domain-containing protein [Muribaculaceae bacterium]